MKRWEVTLPGSRLRVRLETIILAAIFLILAAFNGPIIDSSDNRAYVIFVGPQSSRDGTSHVDIDVTSAHRDKHFKKDEEHGLYTLDGKPMIWIYWEGEHKPNYLNLCLETIICHNKDYFNIKVVNDSELRSMVDFIHPAYKYLKLNHRSDYFRGVMLHTYGGFYLDADTLGLSDMRDLYDTLKDYDAVGCTANADEILSTSDMGPFRADSAFTRKYVSTVHAILDKHQERLERHHADERFIYPVSWTELSINLPNLMGQLVSSGHMRYHALDGATTWLQIAWPYGNCASGWLEPEDIRHTHFLTLNNKFMPWEYKHLSNDSVLAQPFILSKLMKQSLAECREKGKL